MVVHCETSFGKRHRERMPLPASGVKVAHKTARSAGGWVHVPEQRGPSRSKHNRDRSCSRNLFYVGQGSTGAQRVAGVRSEHRARRPAQPRADTQPVADHSQQTSLTILVRSMSSILATSSALASGGFTTPSAMEPGSPER